MGETESLNTQFVLIQTIELCLDLKKKRMCWLDLHNDFLIYEYKDIDTKY